MEETIVAIATAPGEGGIGIIRISGPEAKEILGKIFVAKKSFIEKPRELIYGHIVSPEEGGTIDEVLSVFMPGPETYTREDVVEINCHGGGAPVSKILSLIISQGARMAEPGEFTKRAFLNGRIDLAQAEAVIDVINAKTDDSLDAAISQLEGKFSEEIEGLRRELTDALVEIDVNIDYPDEDIEELTYSKLKESLVSIQDKIRELLSSVQAGKILREGLNIAIIGKPNAGKSSLLNSLLREARAIVTEIPGTTRDTIQEFANIKGIPVKLTDTAGIRNTRDIIEAQGIERSKKSIEEADLVVLVVDISEEMDEETRELLASVNPAGTILLFNKTDKEQKISDEEIEAITSIPSPAKYGAIIKAALINDDGIKEVEDAIFNLSGYGEAMSPERKRKGAIVTNIRHKTMLLAAENALGDAIRGIEDAAPLELIEIDVRNAYEQMGFITGESVQEDIINEIFSRFCLGK